MSNYIEEYKLISEEYGDRKATRSQIPLIKHIDEGLVLLDELRATNLTKAAYCLHPLLQNDASMCKFLKLDTTAISIDAVVLAMEYRRVANQYLPKNFRNRFDFIELSSIAEVNQMLVADKVQNRKDFTCHCNKYPNEKQLRGYFKVWLAALGISYKYYLELLELL